jgi:hypothetical protein
MSAQCLGHGGHMPFRAAQKFRAERQLCPASQVKIFVMRPSLPP